MRTEVHPHGVTTFHFESFSGQDLWHGFFSRKGGASVGPFSSLNVGGTVGDETAHVAENRQRTFAAAGRTLSSLYDVWQVHSSDVICTEAPRLPETLHAQADAIITNRPEVTLFMRFADCVPVMLFDPHKQVVGLVHAGWKGTVNKVALEAVKAMQVRYGCQPKEILAGIGPSICVDHYPVGDDVVQQAQKAFGPRSREVIQQGETQPHFHLWNANRLVLEEAGVEKIEIAGVCTACDTEHWFSHRQEHGRTGRFGAIIYLSPKNNQE
ncbi:MAG TPA: peptidoglycan editing factor PgeF [Anaerolineaceae bacterium]|nr:peptidoglycan editing factor PgeF [Anaerolineaceae bacterium]HPN51164.1 peptidoglycan editing factor PgeF [Anaerolineaceae bacterium]